MRQHSTAMSFTGLLVFGALGAILMNLISIHQHLEKDEGSRREQASTSLRKAFARNYFTPVKSIEVPPSADKIRGSLSSAEELGEADRFIAQEPSKRTLLEEVPPLLSREIDFAKQSKTLSTASNRETQRNDTTSQSFALTKLLSYGNQTTPKQRSDVPVEFKVQTSSRFAYSFLVGGCDPDNPTYLGYLYDILVSTYIQRQDGSRSDVMVFFQMAYDSPYEHLPPEHTRFLYDMNIQYQYIPKQKDEGFYRVTLEKFRILTLTQYERVMFLDGDVMARGNLDYLFELSTRGVLKENVVMAGREEPANAGLFILAPHEGGYERIQELIREKEERGRALPYPHWDEDIGWGHKIEDPDWHELITGAKGTKWDFYCSYSDQGLLYHWIKYERKSASIFMSKRVHNWGVDSEEGTDVVLQENLILSRVMRKVENDRKCYKGSMQGAQCRPPFNDFIHFTGTSKPWMRKPPVDLSDAMSEESPMHYWYYILSKVNQDLKMGLAFENWVPLQRPKLGLFPTIAKVASVVNTRNKSP
jgi:hypothetical protein